MKSLKCLGPITYERCKNGLWKITINKKEYIIEWKSTYVSLFDGKIHYIINKSNNINFQLSNLYNSNSIIIKSIEQLF